MSARVATLLLLALFSAALVVHGPALGFRFYYDDFLLLRPYSASELRDVWYGTWDPAGIESPFYRPLAVLYYAAITRVTGGEAFWLHLTSLVQFSAVPALIARVALVETRSRAAALVPVAVVALHPLSVTSMSVWISTQIHIVSVLLVLAGVRQWQRRRMSAGGARAWLPVAAPIACALLIKEDVALTFPALLAAHTWLSRRRDDMPPVPREVAAGTAAFLVAYGVWRTWSLGGIGGYLEVSPAQIGRNLLAATAHVIAPGYHGHPALAAASVALVALAIGAGAVMWRRAARPESVSGVFALGSALAIAALLPLGLSAGPARGHHLLVAAALLLGGVASSLGRRAVLAGLAIPVWVLVAIDARTALAPCGPAAQATAYEMQRYRDDLPEFSRRALDLETRRCREEARTE